MTGISGICRDLKVLGLLLGMQQHDTKYRCLCEWDSHNKKHHHVHIEWPLWHTFTAGKMNISFESLLSPEDVYLPPLHIQLGLMKIFVKALDRGGGKLFRIWETCSRNWVRLKWKRGSLLVHRYERLCRSWTDTAFWVILKRRHGMLSSQCAPVCTQEFCLGGGGFNKLRTEGSENRDLDGGSSPLVRGSAHFANEWNPYLYWVVMDVFSTELGIQLSFVKTSEFWSGGFEHPPCSVCHWCALTLLGITNVRTTGKLLVTC
jgi:hypothetical protein